jgi:membrane-associated PAP2 superfamily phosphatase
MGGLKKTTNMPCPKNEIHFGGNMIRTAVWEKYPEPFHSMETIACYPAGHASGGFALMSLFFLFKTKRNRILALIGAIGLGWSMGIYKMAIGDHFFSHTLITMILAWLIILNLHLLTKKLIPPTA